MAKRTLTVDNLTITLEGPESVVDANLVKLEYWGQFDGAERTADLVDAVENLGGVEAFTTDGEQNSETLVRTAEEDVVQIELSGPSSGPNKAEAQEVFGRWRDAAKT